MTKPIEPSSLLAAGDTGNTTTPSPIFILSEDILLCIFKMICGTITASHRYLEEDWPLNGARASSQVCQSWRSLLLDSPTIWGRCINLDVLKNGRSEWWEEVLRRSQSSPLWVVGHVPESTSTPKEESPKDIRSYFTRLLKSWERIQKLDVLIEGSEISEDIRNAFLSPAPILTLFNVYTPGIKNSLFLHTLLPNSTESLFADHAPLLADVLVNVVAFRTDSPWLSNVRKIHIPSHIDIPGVLDLLSRTPLLETLFLPSSMAIENWDPVAAMPLRTRIDLPHLTIMYLTATLASCTTIIDHVSPAKDCSLILRVNIFDPIPHEIQATLKERLPIYIVNHFTAHSPTEICLRLQGREVLFLHATRNTTAPDVGVLKNELRFLAGSRLDGTVVSVFQAYLLASRMSPSIFNTVTRLWIQTMNLPTSVIPDLYAMLLSFQSVEHIITNIDGIRHMMELALQNYQYGAAVLFPKIHTLQMDYLREDDNQSLLQFLERRRGAGLPVAKLDLTWCTPGNSLDFSNLEVVHGLEVVWTSSDKNTVSYVCGSGEPEKLRFSLPPRPNQKL